MIKDIINANNNVAVGAKEIEILKEHFPACFHNGSFDVGRLKEYLKDKIYDLWQANVPGMRDNSYMTLNKVIEPGFRNITYRGMNMVEMRGLWEVENDYMGGPFVCHIFPDQERKNIIILNAFVYAPKYDKRKYLRQVESIIYSFNWQENLEVEK